MKKNKSFLIWMIIIFSIFYVSYKMDKKKSSSQEIIFSDFVNKITNKEIKNIEIKGNTVSGSLNDGKKFNSIIINYDSFVKDLKENNVEVKIVPLSSGSGRFFMELLSWSPILILGAIYYFSMKSVGSGSGNPFKFGKSKAKLLEMKTKITFKDVAGVDEAKNELIEIVDFLKEPTKYYDIGAKIPRGCLLIGAPGTGKTLLARAIAGEANVPFYFISGSDFVEMFVGVGASRVRDMFEEAKKNAPCLIFIDEIDAVGRQRGIGLGGGNDEREQTLNQLLVEMDGFEGNEGIIVIAATNREDVLDKALLRPGRFDRQINVQLPDVKGREEILEVHAKKVKMSPDIDLKAIAKATPGFSGAELANIINEAGLLAARNNKKIIMNEDLEEAKERVVMGVKNQSKVKKEEEIKLTAYHEGGHVVVALHCDNSDPIYKATIISRGNAGGYVSRIPENDRNFSNMTKAALMDDITIALGGRVSEEIIFGKDKITAGALSDIKAATNCAKNMITRFGMNDKIGMVYCADKLQNDNGYTSEACSDEMLKIIDSEIRNIIDEKKKEAERILKENSKELEIIANSLLKYETLTGDEIKDLIAGKEIRQKTEDENIISSSLLTELFNENHENIHNDDNIVDCVDNDCKNKNS